MREQLAQALSKQKMLIVERDQAVEQSKLVQQRADQLQLQLQKLHTTYGNLATAVVSIHTSNALLLHTHTHTQQLKWRNTSMFSSRYHQ